MEFIKRHLSREFTFPFLLSVILQIVSVFFTPADAPAAEALHHAGMWISRVTVPQDIVFQDLGDDVANYNKLAVVSLGQDVVTRYISGFFSVEEGSRAVADTLVGTADFTEDELILVKNLRLSRPMKASLDALKTAVIHFRAAVVLYLECCNNVEIPPIGNLPNYLIESANINELQRIISKILKFIGNSRCHSEMALMFDIKNNRYGNHHIIVTSKLDMCASCETVLNFTSNQRRTLLRLPGEAIPYEIFVGSFKIYSYDHPTSRQNGRHNLASYLFKTALPLSPLLQPKNLESQEIVVFPPPDIIINLDDQPNGEDELQQDTPPAPIEITIDPSPPNGWKVKSRHAGK